MIPLKNTDYLQRLSRFFILLMLVSTAHASEFDASDDKEYPGASASFFVPEKGGNIEQDQEIQALTNFVEARSKRTLEGLKQATDDVLAMLTKNGAICTSTDSKGAQVHTLLHLGSPFLNKHPDGDAYTKLLDIAFLTRTSEGHEAYRNLLLKQGDPDTDRIMPEVRRVFYTASGKDRPKLNAVDVDWVLALSKRGDIKAAGFADYVWRAKNWKYPPKKAPVYVVAEEEGKPPKRRWGNKGFRNGVRGMDNGRNGRPSDRRSRSRSSSK